MELGEKFDASCPTIASCPSQKCPKSIVSGVVSAGVCYGYGHPSPSFFFLLFTLFCRPCEHYLVSTVSIGAVISVPSATDVLLVELGALSVVNDNIVCYCRLLLGGVLRPILLCRAQSTQRGPSDLNVFSS